MTDAYSLRDIQSWFQAVITAPHGVVSGIGSATAANMLDVASNTVEQVILPSRDMNSIDRMQIYGRAYFGRLIECLRSQFPAVHHSIGDEAFDGLAFGYLVKHPSTQYTLASLNHSFDTYLAETRPVRDDSLADQPDFGDFLIELARLERVYCEIFDGPGPERSRSLSLEDFAGLTVDDFARCQLQFHECVRLLEFRFPVHEFATAVRRSTEPPPFVARPVCLAVTRRDYVVRRYELTQPQFALLSALERRVTIGEALVLTCRQPGTDLNEITTEIRTWFHDWSAAPLFSRLIPCPP